MSGSPEIVSSNTATSLILWSPRPSKSDMNQKNHMEADNGFPEKEIPCGNHRSQVSMLFLGSIHVYDFWISNLVQ